MKRGISKKIIGSKSSEFEAVFRIFSNKDKSWKILRTVKFKTTAQFLSILIMAINSQTENILDEIEQLQLIGKKRRKRLDELNKN